MAKTDNHIIELEQALRYLLAVVSDQEVAEHAPRLRRLLDEYDGAVGQFRQNLGIDHEISHPLPEATLAWLKRELAVEWIDRALWNGDLPARLLPPLNHAATAATIPLLPSQWRVYSPEQRHHMVIAGGIIASAGDELWPCDRWRIVFDPEIFTAWRKALARTRPKPASLECRAWLEALMRNNLERSPKRKPELQHEAKSRFGVPERTFNKFYGDGLARTGAKWSAGRPPKKTAVIKLKNSARNRKSTTSK